MAPTTRSMVNPSMVLAQLDDDILNLCVSTMKPDDLACVRLVSRKFESVASQDNLWDGPLADLEKTMPLPQEENWTPIDLATWVRCFPQLPQLMRDDGEFKDPRLDIDPKSWASAGSLVKYLTLRAYDKRVTVRLEQFSKNSSWTVHDRRLLKLKADLFQRFDEGWERVAMAAGVNHGDFGEGLYDYLSDAQERITPATCAKAVAVIAHNDYKTRKCRRGFRILLVGGPAACDLYIPGFSLAVTVSKLI